MKRRAFLVSWLLFRLAPGAAFAAAAEPPAAPTDLKGVKHFKGAVATTELTWKDRSDNELGFEILRSDGGAEFRVVGIVGANSSRYRDEIGKYVTGAFSYRVRGFNQNGKGETSNTVSLLF